MKSILLAAVCCMLLTGCMGIGVSQISLKMLEDRIETDAAVLSLATSFYQDENSVYIQVPVQTFREICPGVALIVGEVRQDARNRFYPLEQKSGEKVWLCRKKEQNDRYTNWESIAALPQSAVEMAKPDDWFEHSPGNEYLERGEVVVIRTRDRNGAWRMTRAVVCGVLLDFPLTVAYSCSAFILAIPAASWY